MNCSEYQDWIQRRLDGTAEPSDAGAQHRLGCGQCAALDDAAIRLERGLRLMPAPIPPRRLAESITHQVLAEQRTTVRRRVIVYAAALAACLMLGIYIGGRNNPETPPVVKGPDVKPPETAKVVESETPKVTERAGEAGTALATLVTRTADEAVGQGRLLLPSNPMGPMTPDVTALPPALEPPAQSLKDAGQSVSAGLEPVTSSAKRAVTLFFRDMPPVSVQ